MHDPISTSAFKQVDVFTSVPLMGNALAVILDAESLDSATMQRIAAWTNLSETAFVLPVTQTQADYRVRIFTPRSELGFAGHPSVGTAHALLEAGRIEGKDHLVQECAAGLLPMRVVGEGSARQIFVRAPPATLRACDGELARAVTTALTLSAPPSNAPVLVDLGLTWLICALDSEAAVRGVAPDLDAVATLCARVGAVGLSVFGRAADAGYAIVVRAFCPGDGVPEDPVTGSANAAIGSYLHASGTLDVIGAQYRASQGREVGRDGYVTVRVDRANGAVEIGGHSVTCVDGLMQLPECRS